MNPGDVVWHRKETTHFLGNGHYIVVRQGWFGGAVVAESSAFDGYCVLHACDTRAEADFIAVAYVATRGLHPTNHGSEA